MNWQTFESTGIYFANPAVMSLYAQGKTTGLVLDSGECTTSVFPVYEGVRTHSAADRTPRALSV